MPVTYPPAPPTISGDTISISRFLSSPTQIARRLRDYRDLRFVSDQVLTGRYRTSGGAVAYTLSEPFVTDRSVESVAPGSEYPLANAPFGTAGLAAAQKWGQRIPLTDEAIEREVYGQALVDRTLKKLVNSIIAQVDSITMSAIASAVTQTKAAAASWITGTPNILRDILLARQVILNLKLGYAPDSLLVNDTGYAYLMSDDKVTNALKREDSTNPIYTGQIERIGGLVLLTSPYAPANPMIFDSNQLGGMADESDGAPGYALSDLAVGVKSIRDDRADKYDLQGRRKTVPVISEPGSAVSITSSGIT